MAPSAPLSLIGGPAWGVPGGPAWGSPRRPRVGVPAAPRGESAAATAYPRREARLGEVGSWHASTRSSRATGTSRPRPTVASPTSPSKYKDRAPRLIRLPDGGATAGWWRAMPMLAQRPEHQGPRAGEVRQRQLLQRRRLPQRGRRRRRPASPRAGPGRHRRRGALRPGVRRPASSSRSPTSDVYLLHRAGLQHWLAEHYCAVAPDRLIGNALIPVSGIDDAVAELERVPRAGLQVGPAPTVPQRSARAEAGGRPVLGEGARARAWPLSPHMSTSAASSERRRPPLTTRRSGRPRRPCPSTRDRARRPRWPR